MSNLLQSIQGIAISIIVIAGLIVLMALGKVSVAEGLNPILLLAGVHVGVNVSNSASGTSSTTTTPPIQ